VVDSGELSAGFGLARKKGGLKLTTRKDQKISNRASKKKGHKSGADHGSRELESVRGDVGRAKGGMTYTRWPTGQNCKETFKRSKAVRFGIIKDIVMDL